LRALGEHYGFSVTVVPPVVVEGTPVNSTRIRSLVERGEVEHAAVLLGRPPILVGDVVHGDRVGRTLGYPTANLAVGPRILLPAHGVYVARVFLDADPTARPALLYIGTRPTIRTSEEIRCEVQFLSPLDAALYGERIEVHLLKHEREERAFASLDDLRHQIARDIASGREILAQSADTSAPIAG